MKKILISIIMFIMGVSLCYAQSSFTDVIGSIGPDPGTIDTGTDGWNLGGMAGLLFEENPTTGETDVYAQIGFQPEFSLRLFFQGLALALPAS